MAASPALLVAGRAPHLTKKLKSEKKIFFILNGKKKERKKERKKEIKATQSAIRYFKGKIRKQLLTNPL